jgi:hypothetical protein
MMIVLITNELAGGITGRAGGCRWRHSRSTGRKRATVPSLHSDLGTGGEARGETVVWVEQQVGRMGTGTGCRRWSTSTIWSM